MKITSQPLRFKQVILWNNFGIWYVYIQYYLLKVYLSIYIYIYAWNKTLNRCTIAYHWSIIIHPLPSTDSRFVCDLFPAICCHGNISEYISDDPRDPKYCFNILRLQALVVNNPRSCKTRGLLTQPTQDCRLRHHQPTQSCTFLACSPWQGDERGTGSQESVNELEYHVGLTVYPGHLELLKLSCKSWMNK